MSDLSSCYRFVLVPVSGLLEEFTGSTTGGLQDDDVQKKAKMHFSDSADGQARLTSVLNELQKNGQDPSKMDPTMLSSLSSMGAAVEIITLCIANRANNFVAVSLYCDGNAVAKKLQVNSRATELAKACGHSLIVHGDAFVGRSYDNEEEEWLRLNITENEIRPDATWVLETAKANEGKNLAKYSSSGVMAQQLSQLSGGASGGTTVAPVVTDVLAVSEDSDSTRVISWIQSPTDVELR